MITSNLPSALSDSGTDPGPENKKRKRQRPIISCTECHRRKQKCDRQQPCANCAARSASDRCRYEARAPGSSNMSSATPRSSHGGPASPPSPTTISETYGYIRSMNSGVNTAVDILEKLNLSSTNAWGTNGTFDIPQDPAVESYAPFISKIPPKPYVLLLTNVFFTECNWIYDSVHEGTFRRLLDEWYSTHGIGASRESLQFTCLILQVMAVACQMLPRRHYKEMAQLTLGKEEFRGLSKEYSDTGCEMGNKLSGNHATVARAQAWFLRASWLKSEGRAIESWHILGNAIRDAYELGLHKEVSSSRIPPNADVVEQMWMRQLEKRLWMNLYIWDRFMGGILGRPTMINDRHVTATPPIDCDMPTPLPKTPPQPRSPLSRPTSITARLLDYQLSFVLNDIEDYRHKISSSTTGPDYAAIDELHKRPTAIAECFPPSLSVFSRDTSFDESMPFLRAQAAILRATYHCIIINLHRPFIFTRTRSRTEIMNSGLEVLESQGTLRAATQEHHHTVYTLNFYTFDPAVLVSAIIITAPQTIDPHIIDRALISLREGKERMENLGRTVGLAAKGAALLSLLLKKAEKSVEENAASYSSSSGFSSGEAHSTPVSVEEELPEEQTARMDAELMEAAAEPVAAGIFEPGELDEIFMQQEPATGGGMEWENEGYWQALLDVPFTAEA